MAGKFSFPERGSGPFCEAIMSTHRVPPVWHHGVSLAIPHASDTFMISILVGWRGLSPYLALRACTARSVACAENARWPKAPCPSLGGRACWLLSARMRLLTDQQESGAQLYLQG